MSDNAIRRTQAPVVRPTNSEAQVPKATPGLESVTVDPTWRPGKAGPGSATIGRDTVGRSVSFPVELTSKNGVGVGFKVHSDKTKTTSLRTQNGVTTFRNATDVTVGHGASATVPKAGVTAGATQGTRTSFEVRMPEAQARGRDLSKVNPFDPTTLPAGTEVRLDGADHASTSFGASFTAFAATTNSQSVNGVSLTLQKLEGEKVRVTVGPTQAVNHSTTAGLDVGVASALAGRTDALGSANLRTAEFDLSKPQGRAAFNDLMLRGKVPEKEGAGVANVATLETLDSSSTQHAQIGLGPLKANFVGQSNQGSSIVTRRPDGSAQLSQAVRFRENVPLQVAAEYKKNGQEDVAKRRYDFTVIPDSRSAQTLNMALTGRPDGAVKPGVPARVSLNEQQMKDLMAKTSAAADRGVPMGGLTPPAGMSTHDFALGLARTQGHDSTGFINRLFAISGAATGSPSPIAATLR